MLAGCAAVGGVVIVVFFVLLMLGFDSLEYQEMGLNYSWITESIEDQPFGSGRHFLGIGNHFIKFPKMVRSIYFIDGYDSGAGTKSYQGPPLQSRTKDGLNVQLEISFQYRLQFATLYQMYTTFGENYEDMLVRMAIEQLTTATTKHPAHFFFTNRTTVGVEMHKEMSNQFEKHAFAEVPFFQLRTVHLPVNFENAIKLTQVAQQEIQIAKLEQKTNRVSYQTEVLRAEQAVKVMLNEAEAEVASIKAQNDAYCQQYKFTQELQSEALEQLQESSGWSSRQLLDYLRIRAVREHPSDKTTIRL